MLSYEKLKTKYPEFEKDLDLIAKSIRRVFGDDAEKIFDDSKENFKTLDEAWEQKKAGNNVMYMRLSCAYEMSLNDDEDALRHWCRTCELSPDWDKLSKEELKELFMNGRPQ